MIALKLVEKCKELSYKISTAESMTGGFIAREITRVPGSSLVFEQGFITYSNEAKMKVLGVKASTINQYSVISKEVALEMVEGLFLLTKADLCISVTGIAGPSSDEFNHPVGLCFIGVKTAKETKVFEYLLEGNREEIQTEATNLALKQGLSLL